MQKVLELLSNKKIKFAVIGVLVVLFLIFLIGAMSKSKNNEPEQPEEQIIEITKDLNTRIQKSVSELSAGPYCTIPSTFNISGDCLYRNASTLKENLTSEYRLASLIFAIGAASDKNTLVGTITVDNTTLTNPHFVNVSEVKEEFEKLYGKDETFTPELVNSITNYTIKYHEKLNKFFYYEKEVETITLNYLEKLETTTTEVTAYVRIGYVTYKNYRYHLHSDKEQQKTINVLSTIDYQKGNLINKDNANNFSQYKFTFTKEKDTNNYIFKQVNLVS